MEDREEFMDDQSDAPSEGAWKRFKEQTRQRTLEELRSAREARREEERREFNDTHTMEGDDWRCHLNPCPWHM